MNKAKVEEFNMVIVGVGGQGLITLLRILARAALIEGYDVKTSELHGLSQRGGSVEVHIRFGKKVFSPLVAQAKANLVLGLEMQECLKACLLSNSKTTFLINKFLVPILGQKTMGENKILGTLKKFSKNIYLIPAAEICQKELDNKVVAGIYLLSYACFKDICALKPDSMLKAIKEIVPEKHLELNKKAFLLAERNAQPVVKKK